MGIYEKVLRCSRKFYVVVVVKARWLSAITLGVVVMDRRDESWRCCPPAPAHSSASTISTALRRSPSKSTINIINGSVRTSVLNHRFFIKYCRNYCFVDTDTATRGGFCFLNAAVVIDFSEYVFSYHLQRARTLRCAGCSTCVWLWNDGRMCLPRCVVKPG